ncbi:hypothetical protein, partial [uncultured Parasutterella sp.]|uniref:hypothetical protein n=1 Tax=uncultured Parasutterella sp. TaxID=1263098 RepID=UPI0025B3018F
ENKNPRPDFCNLGAGIQVKAITGTAKRSSKLRRRSKTLHEFFSVKEEAIPQSAQRCWGG